jgi:hypothetical protein
MYGGAKMKTKIAGFSIFIIFSLCIASQTLPPVKWARPLKDLGIVPQYMIEASGNRILCADTTKIVAVDVSTGEAVKTIEGFSRINSIKPAYNDGFVVADANKITRLDKDLNLLWSKTITGYENATLQSVIQTSDGGYLAMEGVGPTYAVSQVKIFKTDSECDTLWTRVKGGKVEEVMIYQGIGVAESDGVYIVCGVYCPGICKGYTGWVLGYSSDGVEIWSKMRVGYTLYDIEAADGGVVLTGFTESGMSPFQKRRISESLNKRNWFPSTEVCLFKVSPEGNLVLDSVYDLNHYCFGSTVRRAPQSFIIAGYSGVYFGEGDKNEIVMGVDLSGNILWKKEYPSDGVSKALASPFSDGGVVIVAAESLYFHQEKSSAEKSKDRHCSRKPFSIRGVIKNSVIFTVTDPSRVTVDLLNVNGRLVKRIEKVFSPGGDCMLSLGDCVSGIYLLQFRVNSEVVRTGRIIVGYSGFIDVK